MGQTSDAGECVLERFGPGDDLAHPTKTDSREGLSEFEQLVDAVGEDEELEKFHISAIERAVCMRSILIAY